MQYRGSRLRIIGRTAARGPDNRPSAAALEAGSDGSVPLPFANLDADQLTPTGPPPIRVLRAVTNYYEAEAPDVIRALRRDRDRS